MALPKSVKGGLIRYVRSPEYLAPEILLNKGHGKPVDWWTFGVLLYEMIAGIDPFNDDDPMLVYQKILKGKIKFSTAFPSSVKSLVKHLLTLDLSKRYGNLKGGVNDIKNHRFFDDMDWNALIRYKLQPPYIPETSGNVIVKILQNMMRKMTWILQR